MGLLLRLHRADADHRPSPPPRLRPQEGGGLRALARGGLALAALLVALVPVVADERDYVQLVTERRNYAYISAVVEAFGNQTRFKYPEILQTNATAGGRLLCGGGGLGFPDIAVVGTTMNADETALCLGNGVDSVSDIRIGFDTLLAVTVPADETLALSSRDLFLALAARVPAPTDGQAPDGTGTMTFVANPYRRWSEIDPALPDRPILVLMPPRGANETDLLVTTVFRKGCEAVEGIAALEESDPETFERLCVQLRTDDVVVTTDGREEHLADRLALIESGFGPLARRSDPMLYQFYALADPPLAIAFARPATARSAGLAPVTIDGRAPQPRIVASGAYPLSRPIYLRVKTSQFPIVPGLRDFVSAFISAEAIGEGGYLLDVGLTPVSEAERENMRLMLAAARSGSRQETFGGDVGGAQASPSARLRDIERKMWDRMRDSEDPRDFRDFVEYFPDGIFASRARRRAALLERRDTDGDGIADYLDACTGTAQRAEVDPDGCPLETEEETGTAAETSG